MLREISESEIYSSVHDFMDADEWVTQLLRQSDAKVFRKYSPIKLQMKREAPKKVNRKANEMHPGFDTDRPNRWGLSGFCHGRDIWSPMWAYAAF